jgi:hypothetical protein
VTPIPFPTPIVSKPWLEMIWDNDRLIIKNVGTARFDPTLLAFVSSEGTIVLNLNDSRFTFTPILPGACIQIYSQVNESRPTDLLADRNFECDNAETLEETGIALQMDMPWLQDFTIRYSGWNEISKKSFERDLVTCSVQLKQCTVPDPRALSHQ